MMQGTTAATVFGGAAKPGQHNELEQSLRCPRCESTNTKFCYYNNYNLSQPRHFCKDCRRYWTKGGALRNVPVGGGTRKNSKRSSAAAASGGSDSKRLSPASSTATEVLKPEPLSISFPPADDDHRLLDISGSFSSLLCSTVHFGNFLECYPSPDSVPIFKGLAHQLHEPDLLSSAESSGGSTAAAAAAVPENFLGLPGDSGSWAGGWPDLSIYTPGTGFQ